MAATPSAPDGDDFTSLVIHELRTPLMTLVGSLELLRKGVATMPPDTALEFIERSLRATDDLIHLSDLLSQAMRLEAGQVLPAPEPVALAPVVDDAIAGCAPLATPRHALRNGVAPDLVVLADSQALSHIFTNLISNALKYSPRGGAVAISASDNGAGMVEVTVSDEGIGITPEQMPALFGRFARVHDRARWPGIRGTGLGLYVCHLLVTALGGTIRAESAPGAGSTFHLTVPASATHQRAMSAAS